MKITHLLLAFLFMGTSLNAQLLMEQDSVQPMTVTSGWANEAVTIGYITAPSVVGLMFVSALVNDWNAGYVGIPASVMILAAPPLIFAGGLSVNIPRKISHPLAKLGWALYAISIIPTSLALYGFTTDWGTTVPLTVASGILGSASMVVMTMYAFSRAETARNMEMATSTSWKLGISPLSGGVLATIAYCF